MGENLGTITDPELLMEVMETREAIEDGTPEEIKAIGEQNRKRIEESVKELSVLFNNNGILTATMWNEIFDVNRFGGC